MNALDPLSIAIALGLTASTLWLINNSSRTGIVEKQYVPLLIAIVLFLIWVPTLWPDAWAAFQN